MSQLRLKSPNSETRLFHVIGTVLVFAIVGPPIGDVFITGMLGARSAIKNGVKPSDFGLFILMMLTYGVPMAYVFGFLPAVVVGLVIGIWQAYVGRVTWWMALGVGAVAGMSFVAYLEDKVQRRDGPGESEFYVLAALTCVVATLVCWRIARGWHCAPQTETT